MEEPQDRADRQGPDLRDPHRPEPVGRRGGRGRRPYRAGLARQRRRIWQNEIVTAADDKPVTSAKALCDAIAAAKKAKKDKVRLTILRLGRTRFADLTVKAYDPADDEGLDED